jgi:hypothetical protein
LSGRPAPREDEGRPVQAVLQAAGDDAHHAFVELGVEQRHGGRRLVRALFGHQVFQRRFGLLAHAGFHLAPLAVDGVQLLRQRGGARRRR